MPYHERCTTYMFYMRLCCKGFLRLYIWQRSSVDSASALACCYWLLYYIRTCNPHPRCSPMPEVFLQIERKWWGKPRSLGEWYVLRNKWNYVRMNGYLCSKNTRRVGLCYQISKSTEEKKSGLNEKCLNHFRIFDEISFSQVNKYLNFRKNHQILSVFAKRINFFENS